MKDPVKKKRHSYHLFLIADGHQKIREFRITHRHIRGGVVFGVIASFLTVFSFVGLFYYRSLYASLQQERLKVLAYEQEKKDLLNKVGSLEKTVGDNEKLVGKLAGLIGTVGTERTQMSKGIGGLAPSEKFNIFGSSSGSGGKGSFLDAKLDRLSERAVTLEAKIKELTKIQEDKLTYVASTPSIWPVKGWVTSDFGSRRGPFGGGRDFHDGIDIAAQWGTPIVASADGVVTFAGNRGGLGKAVVIDHGFGIKSYYGHTSQIFVHEGQKVGRGAVVAHVGSTGHSTGPHLHYEIHVDGVAVNPAKYLVQ